MKQKGIFSIDDKAVYKGINEVCEIITNRNPKIQKASKVLNNEYSIWVPTLSIKLNDGRIKTANSFENWLNEDRTKITEIDKGNLKPKSFKLHEKQVVFMRVKDRFGKDCVKFLGVFEGISKEMHGNDCIRIFKRIATEIKFSDLQ